MSYIDRLVLLKEGNLAYQGKLSNAVSYFNTIGYPIPRFMNPFDHFLDVLGDPLRPGLSFYEDYQSHRENKVCEDRQKYEDKYRTSEIIIKKQKHEKVSQFLEFWLLLQRTCINYLRNKNLFYMRILTWFLLTLTTFPFYINLPIGANDREIKGNYLGFIYTTVSISFVNGMNTSLLVLPTMSHVLKREVSSKLYNISSFYFALIISVWINTLVFSSIFTPIMYFSSLACLDIFSFLSFYFTIMFNHIIGQYFGLFICSVSGPQASLLFGPFIYTVAGLVSGFYRIKKTLPNYIAWMFHINPYRYFLEIQVKTMSCIDVTKEIPDNLSYTLGSGYCAIILLGFMLAVLFASYLGMRYKTAKF